MAPRTAPQQSPMDWFWTARPFTRTMTALTLGLSILLYTKVLPFLWFLYWPPWVFTIPPQIWRLFTCFMVTGPGISLLFDTYFRLSILIRARYGLGLPVYIVYTYLSKLETASPRFTQRADFYTYIVFLWVMLLGLNTAFTGASLLLSPLILAFTYTACQDDRLTQAHFFVINIPATWVPAAMLFLTFVAVGPAAAKIQATGLIAAHLHDFLTNIYPNLGGGRNFLKTPAFVDRFFASTLPQVLQRAHGTAIIQPRQPTPGSATAPTTRATASGSGGVLPESWRSRGTGHRLGGD